MTRFYDNNAISIIEVGRILLIYRKPQQKRTRKTKQNKGNIFDVELLVCLGSFTVYYWV